MLCSHHGMHSQRRTSCVVAQLMVPPFTMYTVQYKLQWDKGLRSVVYQTDALNLKQPHLPRTHLIERMNIILQGHRFLLLCSSAASGKTSLMNLFANQDGIEHDQVVRISFLDPIRTGFYLLKNTSIDLKTRECKFTSLNRPILCVNL